MTNGGHRNGGGQPPAAKRPLAPFISLEGGEGAGKSTLQRMLVRRARALGVGVLATRQPGATSLGARLRDVLTDPGGEPPTPEAELLLYLADRAQHVARVIRPALAEGRAVICDRFADSSEVYQGRARGLGADRVRRWNQWVCGDVWPDLTLLLDLDPALGLERVNARQVVAGLFPDRLESEDQAFHQAVREGFLEQAAAEPGRLKIIDASRPPEEVADAAWALMEPLLRDWKEAHAA